MSERTAHQVSAAHAPPNYSQGLHMAGATYQHFNGQTMNFPPQNAFNMQNLKNSLPSIPQNLAEYGNNKRSSQTNPLMVMPSGQTIPLSAFYTQNQTHGENMPYMPTNIMPGMMGNNGYVPGPMTQYNWPYGVQNTDTEPVRRVAWSANDENIPVTTPMAPPVQQDYYGNFPYTHPATTASQHYVIGPIQPMKTSDNKGYELMNLDELVLQDPSIPRAVPALWTNQEDMTLAKCLQNPEGITNIYIRGFMPDTTDEDLEGWSARFGEIESCKAIIDQDTGKCKGFGFVMYYSPAAAENCIRGFFHLGFQASYAQKSRNSRLKDLEDKASTNIYCTGVPIDWNESDLAKHFLPYNAVSTKICRDSPSGVSKEVGFARFESREVAERVVKEFHSVTTEYDGVKLYLRFADTKAQKQLKQQSQERRQWRSREYSYSVEHTPSPITGRMQSIHHISPNDSYQSPAGVSNTFTPATSVSPPDVVTINKAVNSVRNSSWPTHGGLQSITNSATTRVRHPVTTSASVLTEIPNNAVTSVAIKSTTVDGIATRTPSPKKVTIKIEPASGKENVTVTPPSVK